MRWLALVGGVLVQIVLGGVYAWSLFGRALQAPEAMGLSHVLAAVPFETAIGMIFVGASIGGRLQDRSSPRVVALCGTAIYGAGILLASLARDAGDYWLLVVGYGLVGGFGLGMAYIVPVALLQKWFPQRAAVVTGLAVGGFGFGATITSPVAQHLIDRAPETPAGAFAVLGVGYLVAGLLGSAMLISPPASAARQAREGDFTAPQALRTPQWYLLTGILTVAVIAGIALISMMAGAAVDVAGLSAGAAAGAVGILALFNGGGRIIWAAVAQRVGQLPVLTAILAIEGVALLVLPHTTGVWFLVLSALVYLCYGGAFGTMPSTAGRFFGLTHAGAIYGLMLVGWSLGGVVGPLLASSLVGEVGNYTLAFSVIGALAVAGVVLPLVTRAPRTPTA
ncbi:L-lactate MFS transporter [Tessaracoccus caeni]|uniref:L-lactate MFS transporter n=1 Tax=Tessaracoccus caeni TaxID=3031239 RepID=UPI0023DBEE89|nr:OFA family MFS transporter [Tessaracoccus caeni]MDF1487343.1 OFA family MFS transporter [Tessaracoccus caeni]